MVRTMAEKWFLAVNPHAGSDKGIRRWDSIERALVEAGVDFSFLFTGKRLDAREMVKEAIGDGWRNIAAVGGDGTVNEVVNGIFSQDVVPAGAIRFGLIQVGTGNDWARSVARANGLPGGVNALLSEKEAVQDVGYADYRTSGGKERRYFVNMAGFGFDAEVAFRTNRSKDLGKGGRFSYLRNLLAALIRYRPAETELVIDGVRHERVLFSLAAGIGRFNGNGMEQLPRAVMDDGYLDYVIYGDLKRLEIAANIKKLYRGGLEGHPKVEYGRCRAMMIRGNRDLRCECDGEMVEEGPYEIGLIPRALRVAVP